MRFSQYVSIMSYVITSVGYCLYIRSAGIFKQSMGARNRVGTGLSYRPATQPGGIGSLESIPRLLKSLKIPTLLLGSPSRSSPSAAQAAICLSAAQAAVDRHVQVQHKLLHGQAPLVKSAGCCRTNTFMQGLHTCAQDAQITHVQGQHRLLGKRHVHRPGAA